MFTSLATFYSKFKECSFRKDFTNLCAEAQLAKEMDGCKSRCVCVCVCVCGTNFLLNVDHHVCCSSSFSQTKASRNRVGTVVEFNTLPTVLCYDSYFFDTFFPFFCLVWAEIECTMHFAMHKGPINQFKTVQKSRKQLLRAYCSTQ